MEYMIEKFKGLIKYWWVILLLGVTALILGFVVFLNPAASFASLAIIFAVVMIVSGLMQVVVAFSENYLPGRGWIAVGGVLEFVLGLVLLLNPAISMVVLPFLLAFWMMLHGFSTIGFASDLRAMKISGMGWTIFMGILLVLCGIVILFLPIVGVKLIVVMLGVGLIIAGITISALAVEIYGIRRSYHRFLEGR